MTIERFQKKAEEWAQSQKQFKEMEAMCERSCAETQMLEQGNAKLSTKLKDQMGKVVDLNSEVRHNHTKHTKHTEHTDHTKYIYKPYMYRIT